jgi:hypothetical protein
MKKSRTPCKRKCKSKSTRKKKSRGGGWFDRLYTPAADKVSIESTKVDLDKVCKANIGVPQKRIYNAFYKKNGLYTGEMALIKDDCVPHGIGNWTNNAIMDDNATWKDGNRMMDGNIIVPPSEKTVKLTPYEQAVEDAKNTPYAINEAKQKLQAEEARLEQVRLEEVAEEARQVEEAEKNNKIKSILNKLQINRPDATWNDATKHYNMTKLRLAEEARLAKGGGKRKNSHKTRNKKKSKRCRTTRR